MDQNVDDDNTQGVENYAQKVHEREKQPVWEIDDDICKYLTDMITEEQQKKGSPPTLVEMRQAFCKNPGPHAPLLARNRHIFYVAWKKDTFYMDKTASYLSTERWNDEYKTSSEVFDEKFKPLGYTIDEKGRARATADAKTVEFTDLWDILISDDEQKLKDNEWIFSDIKNPIFLKRGSAVNVETTGNHVGFLSFPRTGNSFLRKYLHNITGIQTGSDMDIDMGLIVHQRCAEFLGEHVVDDSVWIKKSHDPMQLPGSLMTKCNKVICCVRNPYDVMISMTHFQAGVMSGVLKNNFAQDIPGIWNELIRGMTDMINAYHSHMMLEIAEHVPVYYLRYEDLLLKPQETLEGLFCFIMNKESIEGLNIQKRIKAAVEMGHKTTVTYDQKVDFNNLKNADQQINEKKYIFNRNIDQFNEEQQEYVSTQCQDYFEIFGYCKKMADGEAELDRFRVSDQWLTEQQTELTFAKFAEINTEQLSSYQKMNAQALTQVCELAAENKLKEKVYICNADPEQQIKMPWAPEIYGQFLMQTQLKEKPQIKKE